MTQVDDLTTVKGKNLTTDFLRKKSFVTSMTTTMTTTVRKQGKRGLQKLPPSGHLAPTLKIQNGKVYPIVEGVDFSTRQAKKFDHPQEVPSWFFWLYQWSEKDTLTGLWHLRSKYVPSHKVDSVQYMITTKCSVREILKFISH